MESIYKPAVQSEQTHISEAVIKKLVAASNCIGTTASINNQKSDKLQGVLSSKKKGNGKTLFSKGREKAH